MKHRFSSLLLAMPVAATLVLWSPDSAARPQPACDSPIAESWARRQLLEIWEVKSAADVPAESRALFGDGVRRLCLARRDRVAAQERYDAALSRYLKNAAEISGSDADRRARSRAAKRLFDQCITVRSTTNRFHMAEALIAGEEYARLCLDGLRHVYDEPDDVSNVRRYGGED